MEDKVSLLEIFGVFAKVGAFTIGGGYMIVTGIQAELSRRHWLSDDELPDIVAIAQSAPGLLAVNMSIFAGYRLRGVKGSIVATLGSILPSFVIILLIAMVFANFKDSQLVMSIFSGIRPVAVALILATTVRMARKNCRNWWALAIAIATLLAVAFLKISAIYIILTMIVCATAVFELKEHKR